MIKIVLARDFVKASGQSAASFPLSSQRQERADKLFSDQEKRRFIAAEMITSKLITQDFGISDIEICGHVSQKPYLKNHPDIGFNRSYCGDDLVVAISDTTQIGVDCEVIKTADDAVMKYFFTDCEQEFVKKCFNKNLAFTLIWTRKESYIKNIGEGLHFQWNLIDVTPKQLDWTHSPLSFRNDPINGFYINSYYFDDIVLSLCTQTDEAFPSVIQEWR